ncbi:hypothetical protein NC652_029215 [Populus alba x Populus x berolinensis]|nr:hypothetical protein NC652_029215 [Populus alba x Populus x berolinensis]
MDGRFEGSKYLWNFRPFCATVIVTWFSFANGRYSFWTNLWMFVATYTLFKPKMANIYLIHDPSFENNAFMNNKYHTKMLFILLISLNATTKSGLRSRIMQFAGCSIASANFWNPEHGNSLLRVFYSVFKIGEVAGISNFANY